MQEEKNNSPNPHLVHLVLFAFAALSAPLDNLLSLRVDFLIVDLSRRLALLALSLLRQLKARVSGGCESVIVHSEWDKYVGVGLTRQHRSRRAA
jgi:hypothetical protein